MMKRIASFFGSRFYAWISFCTLRHKIAVFERGFLIEGFSSLGSAVLGWSHAGLLLEDLR